MDQHVKKMVEEYQNDRTIFSVENLTKEFYSGGFFGKNKKIIKAVNDVNFSLHEKETYSLVGESGCGKSTTGRAALRLIEPTAGKIMYRGREVTKFSSREMMEFRRRVQMIFQDPYSSLNPRMTIDQIVKEPLKIHKTTLKQEYNQKTAEILEKVGIRPDQFKRYPHEFSGGQKQRISMARALILNPEIIVCDEPVSALDVSIQAQVLNLFRKLQEELNVSYLFISHDMSVVKYISDRIGVMYLGSIVEEAETEELFAHPLHPYTQALLSAVPEADPEIKKERIILEGEIPSPLNIPSGCPFRTRCKYATEKCASERPVSKEVAPGHRVACHQYD